MRADVCMFNIVIELRQYLDLESETCWIFGTFKRPEMVLETPIQIIRAVDASGDHEVHVFRSIKHPKGSHGTSSSPQLQTHRPTNAQRPFHLAVFMPKWR
jgi:hypothetical protein